MNDELRTKIKVYKLMDPLFDRLQIVINGGCARSTIYKALQVGPQTDRLQLILDNAAKVVAEHEAKIAVIAA